MRPRTFFWTTFLSLVVAILISSALFGALLYRRLYTATLETLKSDLRKEAVVLADAIESSPELLARPHLVSSAVHTDDRITIMKPDGTVVADNWAERMGKEAIENHATRPEFQAALHDHPIFQRRFSHTLSIEMLYYAVPVKPVGKTALVLRLSFALTTFYRQMADIRAFLYTIALLNILFSLPFAFLLSRRILRPIRKLRAGSRRLAQGHLEQRVAAQGSVEFRELAADFNRMADELQQKVESLRQEHQRIETLLARMAEGVLALDASGRAVFANSAFARINDSTPQKIEGKHYLEFARNNELIDRIAQELARVDEPAGDPRDVRIFGRDGEKTYSMQASRIRDEKSRLLLLLLVFHDITKIKLVEQMRKDFVANVSHELRTPLTAVKGSVEVLLDGACSDEAQARRFLQIIDKQLRNMQNLVSDMLKLASVEEMRMPIRRETVEVQPFLEEIVSLLRPLSTSKNQAIEIDAPQERLWMSVDTGQMRDALMNLLDNAVKYSQEKSRIVVRAATENGGLMFSVEDNGPGIAPDQLPRIFERFYRVDKSRSREMGGTGLGLSIAKHAVENHGGTITAESRPGLGTTFCIHLPNVVPLVPGDAHH